MQLGAWGRDSMLMTRGGRHKIKGLGSLSSDLLASVEAAFRDSRLSREYFKNNLYDAGQRSGVAPDIVLIRMRQWAVID